LIVLNVRTFAAKLDADGDVGTTTYAAGLTAKVVETNEHASSGLTVEGLDVSSQFITEKVVTDLLTQHNALCADLDTNITKLNADAGVTATNYARIANKIPGLGLTAPLAGDDKIVPPIEQGGGGWHGNLLYQIGVETNLLLQDYHNAGAALDTDGAVTATDFEAQFPATTQTLSFYS
jgi:hypothetical protein